ncbi:MAG: hypothetical protein RLZZ11_308, partial [Cyanobacteriota bacterium]
MVGRVEQSAVTSLRVAAGLALAGASLLSSRPVMAQNRIPKLPGYD